MNRYRQQVQTVVDATQIHSATTFSWFGKASPPLPRSSLRALTPEAARGFLLHALQTRLYVDMYCRGEALPSSIAPTARKHHSPTPFVADLSSANSGQGQWQSGWQIQAIENDLLVIQRNGLTVRAPLGSCRVTGAKDASFQPGGYVELQAERELLAISPGFYMAMGDTELLQHPDMPLIRIYWNITPSGAVPLMRGVTTALNQAKIAFQFKVLNDPALFSRCDAAVLYVAQEDYDAVASALGAIYPAVASHLKPHTPVFTKRLAPGIGLAEDPGGNTSFGLHRCLHLADALIRAAEEGIRSPAQRMQFVQAAFAQSGIDLEAPYRNPGSTSEYPFTRSEPAQALVAAGHHEPIATPLCVAPPTLSAADLLKASVEIGRRLTGEAIWYRDCCNWIGPRLDSTAFAALGPTLYDGTAGIGLFLAELYAQTSEKAFRLSALGAINQSLRRAAIDPALHPFGLYLGQIGIALAAVRAVQLLGDEPLLAQAKELLTRCSTARPTTEEFDLMSGYAGAIVAALALQPMLQDMPLLSFAMRLGDRLLQTAQTTDAGLSWPSTALPRQKNLTGFSHGASGIGYALLELFGVTGEVRYRQAAESAYGYERHWFDARAQNWPDFRHRPPRQGIKRRIWPCAAHWCHGAPGIALSRLRAAVILGDPLYQGEAITALHTTRTAVEIALRVGGENFSLCHGLTGNAEVLRYGTSLLGHTFTDGLTLPLRVAQEGLSAYGASGRPWPCGVQEGESPCLMLGLAGIGYFYLRMSGADVPSMLLLHPRSFTKQPNARSPIENSLALWAHQRI